MEKIKGVSVRAALCPDLEMLQHYHLGQLAVSEVDMLEKHLEACSRCQAHLEHLEGEADSFLLELREAQNSTEKYSTAEMARLTPKLGILGQLGAADRVKRVVHSLEQIGDYKLVRLLGKGGFGEVYLARAELLGREVAVKVLREKHSADPVAKARFLQEMRAIGQLRQHPNLVHAYQASEEKGRLYLVLEYIEGIDLARLTQKLDRWPWREACEACRQTALGLHHISQHGLVHRDLKPGNLILTHAGMVKILDLGLARLAEDETHEPGLTDSGCFVGTPDYIAPEQTQEGRTADCRADIYALGCTLYHFLSGAPPFKGLDLVAKLNAHRNVSPKQLSTMRPELPSLLDAIIDRMLAKSPEDRYQAPLEVARALEPFCVTANLAAVALGAASPSDIAKPPSGTASGSLQHWLFLSISAALLVLLGVVASQIWHRRDQSSKEQPLTTTDLGPWFQLPTPAQPLHSLALSGNGLSLVGLDSTHWQVWDLKERTLRGRWLHHGRPDVAHAIACSLDGKHVFVGSNRESGKGILTCYDASTGSPIREPIDVGGWLLALTVPSGGDRLAAADNQKQVHVVEINAWRMLTKLPHPRLVRALALSESAGLLTGCDDGILRFWNPAVVGRPVQELATGGDEDAFLTTVGISPDAGLASCVSQRDHVGRLWNLRTGTEFEKTPLAAEEDAVSCMALAADGRRVVVGYENGAIAVWDLVARNRLVRYPSHAGPVAAIAVSPDRRFAASIGKDDKQLWLHVLPK